MYSGDYLERGNIGHEVINLFKSDNVNHYIYAMSAGDYDTKRHFNTIKKIILVRNVDEYKVEVLGIADIAEEVFASQIPEPSKYISLPSTSELFGFIKSFSTKSFTDGSIIYLSGLSNSDTKTSSSTSAIPKISALY